MDADTLPLSPCTTLHDYPRSKCACWSSGSLEELPFLHTIVENAPHSYVARGYSTICRTLCWLFGLFPAIIRRMLYRTLKVFDNLFLLFACYVEHAYPWASMRLWGSEKALGARTSARSLVSVADTYEMDIDLPILIIRDSAIESTRAEAEEIMAEDMTVNMAVNMDSTERGTEAGAGPMSSSEALTTVDNGSNQSHIEIDDIEVDASDDGNSIAKENTEVQGTSQPLEDEGYISADENSWSPETCPEHLSVRQPQMQQVVRSAIFEPLDSLEHSEIARPPLLALLTASAHSLPLPPPPHRQSDGNGKLSSFPSLQTFDEIPGLRRQSLSGAETKRLVTISAEAASRAHHHWLRPCAACARKAGAESKGWHLLQKKKKKKTGNDTRGEISIEGRQELGVYSRTVHWVKKQEERIKQL